MESHTARQQRSLCHCFAGAAVRALPKGNPVLSLSFDDVRVQCYLWPHGQLILCLKDQKDLGNLKAL